MIAFELTFINSEVLFLVLRIVIIGPTICALVLFVCD